MRRIECQCCQCLDTVWVSRGRLNDSSSRSCVWCVRCEVFRDAELYTDKTYREAVLLEEPPYSQKAQQREHRQKYSDVYMSQTAKLSTSVNLDFAGL